MSAPTPLNVGSARAAAAPGGRTVLVIAYKFPDVILPGGSVRLEKLLQYLPNAWRPVVLSVEVPDEMLVETVHTGADVYRTRSHYGTFTRAYSVVHLEAGQRARKKGLDLLRRLKNLFLVPDDAVLWWPWAWPQAKKLIEERAVDLVFSSGPPYSCLLLGALVAKRAGVPFVADMRDDWAGNPLAGKRNITQQLTEHRFERWLVAHSARMIHVTEASLKTYRERYPQQADHMVLLRNGYDETDFAQWQPRRQRQSRFLIVHTGSLKDGRDPQPLLQAIASLVKRHASGDRLRFRQIGTTHREYVDLAEALGLGARIEWTERLQRQRALQALMQADALLLLPTQSAPTAIPGKAYEYLRSGKPILVVSSANEATRFLGRFPGVEIRTPDDVAGIADTLGRWLDGAELPQRDLEQLRQFSRQGQAQQLAALFDEVLAQRRCADGAQTRARR